MAAIIDPGSFLNCTSLLSNDLLLGSFLEAADPMDIKEWLYSLNRTGRRKQLIKAWKELVDRGQYHSKFELIQAFVKSELLPLFKGTECGPDIEAARYVARLIQAPHDETHLVAGPYLKPLISRLKEKWHWDNWIFYASVAPDKLNKWLHKHCAATSWFWSDYSAFDATWTSNAWDMVESIYKKIYPDADPDFWRVLSIWRQPHGKMRSRKEDIKIEYWADVCNASGRDDTALANALFNGLALALAISAALCNKAPSAVNAADLAVASELVAIAIVGDDSLCACSFDATVYQSQIVKNLESFGLQVAAETSHSLVDVTFLGMMPYMVNGSFYWGPTLGRRMYKAFWQREPIGNLPAWTRGVAQQLMLFRNVPILYELAQRVDSLLAGQKVTRVQFDENRPWTAIAEEMPQWDSQTVDWLCARYRKQGLTRQDVFRDLKVIRSIRRLPAVVHLTTLDIAVSTDDL